jgi:hypothetical protein
MHLILEIPLRPNGQFLTYYKEKTSAPFWFLRQIGAATFTLFHFLCLYAQFFTFSFHSAEVITTSLQILSRIAECHDGFSKYILSNEGIFHSLERFLSNSEAGVAVASIKLIGSALEGDLVPAPCSSILFWRKSQPSGPKRVEDLISITMLRSKSFPNNLGALLLYVKSVAVFEES